MFCFWEFLSETEIQELISLQTQQTAELQNLVQKLCQDNAMLKEIIEYQTLEGKVIVMRPS